MNFTKLVHSCLLVDSGQKRVLVDPGEFSWQSGLVKTELLKVIDSVVVTHAHPDHLSAGFAEAIKTSSPDANWYGTPQVAATLKQLGIECFTVSDNPDIRFVQSEHADLSPWSKEQTDHTSFVILGDVLINGDCHTITSSHGAKIFAAAVTAPWGSVANFCKMIEQMTDRPDVVVPLHDWHWSEEARESIYSRMPQVLGELGVDFAPIENGKSMELSGESLSS